MSNPEVLRCNHNSYTGLVCRHLYTSFSKLLKSKPSSFLLDLTNYPDHSRCLLKSRSHADHLRLVSRCRPAKGWWRMTGSNRRPPACKAGALPAELIPHLTARYFVAQTAHIPKYVSRLRASYHLPNTLNISSGTTLRSVYGISLALSR